LMLVSAVRGPREGSCGHIGGRSPIGIGSIVMATR
jgi:hypothetical protein